MKPSESTPPPNADRAGTDNNGETRDKIVRLLKTIVYTEGSPGDIDTRVVSPKYYNRFNFELISNYRTEINVGIGISSATQGEGKTLVASNLAVSLATGYQRKTVLVDLNIANPQLHKIFGTPLSPGLSDALNCESIQVTPTRIQNLFVLSGGLPNRLPGGDPTGQTAVRLEQIAAFRDVIYSLEQEFEFIIVDMPSTNSGSFPSLFAYQLKGILIVMHAGKTKREDIEKMFRQVDQHHVLGFVLNRYDEDTH